MWGIYWFQIRQILKIWIKGGIPRTLLNYPKPLLLFCGYIQMNHVNWLSDSPSPFLPLFIRLLAARCEGFAANWFGEYFMTVNRVLKSWIRRKQGQGRRKLNAGGMHSLIQLSHQKCNDTNRGVRSRVKVRTFGTYSPTLCFTALLLLQRGVRNVKWDSGYYHHLF